MNFLNSEILLHGFLRQSLSKLSLCFMIPVDSPSVKQDSWQPEAANPNSQVS